LLVVGNTLYFGAFDELHGYELWKSDGTGDGTQLVKDISPGIDSADPNQLSSALDQ
jgi:ELWxxDGT repeat protein